MILDEPPQLYDCKQRFSSALLGSILLEPPRAFLPWASRLTLEAAHCETLGRVLVALRWKPCLSTRELLALATDPGDRRAWYLAACLDRAFSWNSEYYAFQLCRLEEQRLAFWEAQRRAWEAKRRAWELSFQMAQEFGFPREEKRPELPLGWPLSLDD